MENLEMVIGSATRKDACWYPVLNYPNGGRVIGGLLCYSQQQAEAEANEMVSCMEQHPAAFADNHPRANQLIDLREADEPCWLCNITNNKDNK